MKNIAFIFTAMIVFVLGSCSTQKFHTTKMQNQDFTQYRTYGWLPPIDSLSKDYYNNDIAKDNIFSTANKELEARGLRYSKENPDILFRYVAIVNNKSKMVYSSPYYGGFMGGPWGWYRPWGFYGGYMGGSYPVGKERVRYGHIIIEAIDRQQNKVIWQARGSQEVDSPEKAINKLPSTVSGIINQYPVVKQQRK